MALIPRVVISFVICLLGFLAVIHYFKVPTERYMPTPSQRIYATSIAAGTVTRKDTKGLGDHILEGSDTFWYVYYTFHPNVVTEDKHGRKHVTASPDVYDGAVRVKQMVYDEIVIGEAVRVNYDPIDPDINGVAGTLGIWSKNTGYLNKYLLYYLGLLAATYLVQEIIRMATKTNDLR